MVMDNIEVIFTIIYARYGFKKFRKHKNNLDELTYSLLFYKNIDVIEYLFVLLIYEELNTNNEFHEKFVDILLFITVSFEQKLGDTKNNKKIIFYKTILQIVNIIYSKLMKNN